MTNGRKILLSTLAVLCIVLTFSCKKVIDTPKGDDDGGDDGNGTEQKDAYYGDYTFSGSLYDSLYMYAKAFYLWNSELPTFEKFNPAGYENGDELLGLQSELYAFSQIAVNPATRQPYEYDADYRGSAKYSYMLLTADNSGGGNSSFVIRPNVQSFTLDGFGNDLGIHFAFTAPFAVDTNGNYILNEYGDRTYNQDTTITVLKYVDKGSPADLAGLKRGDIIYKMNGEAKGFDDFNSPTELNNYYNGITDGSRLDIVTIDSLYPKSGQWKVTENTLTKDKYELNPVMKDTVINLAAGTKVGYMVLEAFTEMKNAKPYLDETLQKFEGITDLVVDLRYNGGGAVQTAEYLANTFVASGNDGKTLFTMTYNDSLRDASTYSPLLTSVLKSQKLYEDDGVTPSGKTTFDIDYSVAKNTSRVKKLGTIEPRGKRIYFIVAGGTASASELLINSLKPYNSVYLVGALYAEDVERDKNNNNQIRTYGKPVGFFDLRVGDYTVYMSMFESLNANGEGDYYQGFLTDALGYDDVVTDFAKSEDAFDPLNRILVTLDETFEIPGSSAHAANLKAGLNARQMGGNRKRMTPMRSQLLQSFEAQQHQRNFKPMIRKTLKLN